MNNIVITLLIVILILGCGTLQSNKDSDYTKKQRSLNFDPYHIQSCGPQAIQDALLQFGIRVELKGLSHAMQSSPSCSNLIRDIISVFYIDGRKITFPSELKNILKKNGFKIVNVSSINELDKNGDTAIILVKKKDSMEYHWMCFPTHRDIETFFGKDTIIKEIYLIKR